MVRNTETMYSFERELITRIQNYIKSGGVLKDIPSAKRLLTFCYDNQFPLHSIIIAHGLIPCSEFSLIYRAWVQLHGKRYFSDRQNAEAFFIKKSMQFKDKPAFKNKH